MHKGLCEIAGTFVPDSPGYLHKFHQTGMGMRAARIHQFRTVQLTDIQKTWTACFRFFSSAVPGNMNLHKNTSCSGKPIPISNLLPVYRKIFFCQEHCLFEKFFLFRKRQNILFPTSPCRVCSVIKTEKNTSATKIAEYCCKTSHMDEEKFTVICCKRFKKSEYSKDRRETLWNYKLELLVLVPSDGIM